jgi:hypothetical protein
MSGNSGLYPLAAGLTGVGVLWYNTQGRTRQEGMPMDLMVIDKHFSICQVTSSSRSMVTRILLCRENRSGTFRRV